jgi:hypothetical protein
LLCFFFGFYLGFEAFDEKKTKVLPYSVEVKKKGKLLSQRNIFKEKGRKRKKRRTTNVPAE